MPERDHRPNEAHLLLVEDDEYLARGLSRNLELEGFRVSVAYTGEAGLDALRATRSPFDLLILDVMLPGIDGLEVCRRLRRSGNEIPILFLTARGAEGDRILGLRLGGDDYLPKPFSFEELALRIRGVLRRSRSRSAPEPIGARLDVAGCEIRLDELEADTPHGVIRLTDQESRLLRFLAENEGRTVSRAELLERVWGYTHTTSTRTLDTFIHRLRRYFEPDPHNPRHFVTVRGVGYRFSRDPLRDPV